MACEAARSGDGLQIAFTMDISQYLLVSPNLDTYVFEFSNFAKIQSSKSKEPVGKLKKHF